MDTASWRRQCSHILSRNVATHDRDAPAGRWLPLTPDLVVVLSGVVELALGARLFFQLPLVVWAHDAVTKRVAATIAGHELEPAGQVFENVQRLEDVNAGTLLEIMNIGYAKALGVACSYCHNEDNFASEEKRPKKAAREMQMMHRSINDQLREMKNLSSEAGDRSINCNACHRGQIKPFRG